MKLSTAALLLAAPVAFGFAPQQAAFRQRSSLSATEAATDKKVRLSFCCSRSENPIRSGRRLDESIHILDFIRS